MQEKIIDALRRGDADAALRFANIAIADAPGDAQLHRLLAFALAARGDRDGAHRSIDRALALAPDDASLHYQRAALLVSEGDSDAAETDLRGAIGLNPNDTRAYVMQAQIALGRGDVDEADRLARLAARAHPDHPWVLAVQSMILIHRQQPREAHVLAARAAKLAPEDMQTRYALGLSFLAQQHYAFAEQTFQGMVDRNPAVYGTRHMLADAMRMQGRFVDAAGVLEAGLAVNDAMPPDLMRFTAELWLTAGDHERALPLLRRATAAMPDDTVALDALIEALRRRGDMVDARATIEAALARAPGIEGLWSARVSFEPVDGDIAPIARRWHAALPESIHPLHLQMWVAARAGDPATTRSFADRILERDPGHLEANTVVIEQLYESAPDDAVAHIESLLPRIRQPDIMRAVLGWLARAQDRAGRYEDAVATWRRLDAIHDPESRPLPRFTQANAIGVAGGEFKRVGTGPVFLFGPPGSAVERVVATLNANETTPVCTDRGSATPPQDPLQDAETAQRLASGGIDGTAVVDAWRRALPARTARPDEAIDWLLWWDNALLRAIPGALPGATLLLVVCDPRDMLVDWLQRGTFLRYRIESPETIAAWLAQLLERIVTLVEQDLVPHRLLRVDDVADDRAALATLLGDALGVQEMAPAVHLGPGRFAAGHWRKYRDALADGFALLSSTAQRLGYPET